MTLLLYAMAAPQDVWKIVERADERIKYAQNRDPAEAYRQARDALAEAISALAFVQDAAAAAGLRRQIERRLADLDRLEGEL